MIKDAVSVFNGQFLGISVFVIRTDHLRIFPYYFKLSPSRYMYVFMSYIRQHIDLTI